MRKRSAARLVAVGLVGRAVADDRLDPDERGLVRARLGRRDRDPDDVHVLVAVLHSEPLPAVGLVALGHILREGELGTAVDGEDVGSDPRDEEDDEAQRSTGSTRTWAQSRRRGGKGT